MKSKKNIYLLLFSLITLMSFAKNENRWTIIGRVIEETTQEVLPYANVTIYSKKDNKIIDGVITHEDGTFKIDNIKLNNVYLKVSFMGYEDFVVQNIPFNLSNKIIDIGDIKLKPDVESLSEIVVKSESKPIKSYIDKQVLNVSSNLQATGGTAADALALSPSVRIDSQGNVNLRGSTNFIVLINGKPTTLNSNDVIKQTPANAILKIEVITNPSVKYNAQGGAGIINIILKKGYISGLNGRINTSIGSRDKYSGDVTLNLNKEKVSYSLGIDWRDYSSFANNDYTRTLVTTDNTNLATMFQDRKVRSFNLGMRFGIDYNPNEKNNFSYSLHTGYNKISGQILNTNSEYTVPETTRLDRFNPFYFNQKPTFFTNNFGYQRKLNDKNDELSLNLYYSHINYSFANRQSSFIADEDQNIIDTMPYQLRIFNNNYSDDLRFDIDYTKYLSKKNTLELGSSYHKYYRFLDLTFSEFDYTINDWVNNQTYTGQYDFKEIVYAGYLNLNTTFWNLQTSFGLRVEHMDRNLVNKSNDEDYPFQRTNFFPGASIQKKLTDNANLKFALTNRINRPDEYYMNPYPEFQDNVFVSEGNPNLTPEIIQNFELGYSYNKAKTSFMSNLYYRTTSSKIDQRLTVRDDERILLLFHNNSADKTLGFEFMLNQKINNWWSINANFNPFYYDIKANIDGVSFHNYEFSWSTQIANSIKLDKNTSLQILSYYQSKTARSQGYLTNFFFTDIAIKKTLFKGLLTANLQIKDVFQSRNYELITNFTNLNIIGDFNNESPIAIINLSFDLNKFKKKTKNTNTKFDM